MISLLAEAEPAAQQAPQNLGDLLRQMMPMLVMMAMLMYFIVIRPQSSERKQREKLLSGLKRNDRVVTFSGIIGTVTNFSSDGKEVTLRVDDNVKLQFLRTAIQGPLSDTPPAETNKPSAS
ncbi:MAG: preprotein translocase subunit YajC [Planctomycetia bacterium]|nr:preprotein translocase subunit YajC [Planctomycetia bacterium]